MSKCDERIINEFIETLDKCHTAFEKYFEDKEIICKEDKEYILSELAKNMSKQCDEQYKNLSETMEHARRSSKYIEIIFDTIAAECCEDIKNRYGYYKDFLVNSTLSHDVGKADSSVIKYILIGNELVVLNKKIKSRKKIEDAEIEECIKQLQEDSRLNDEQLNLTRNLINQAKIKGESSAHCSVPLLNDSDQEELNILTGQAATLNIEEREYLKLHVSEGEKRIGKFFEGAGIELSYCLAKHAAGDHHLWWNDTCSPKKGYLTTGCNERAVSFIGRCMAIGDVYDAIRDDRGYKAEKTHKYAKDEFIKYTTECGKQQFDPSLVAFLLCKGSDSASSTVESAFDKFEDIFDKFS